MGIQRWILASICAISACTVGESTEPFDDVEQGLVVLEGKQLADELVTSPIHISPTPFMRLGLLYDADNPADLELSTSSDGETWSAWQAPLVHHTEVEGVSNVVGQIELPADATAKYFRVRGRADSVGFVRIEMLGYRMAENMEGGGEVGTAELVVGNMPVHTRSEWGARSPACSSSMGSITRMTIHHTESPTNDAMSPEARLRQIQSYAMDVKGWCDIGYHYLISRDGRIWEGRPETQLGAHTGGANAGNIGIAFMGTHNTTPITQTQLDAAAALVKSIADRRGVTLDRAHVKGHSELNTITCPGQALYGQLGAIVTAAQGGGGGGGGGGGDCSLGTDAPWRCTGLTGTTTNSAQSYYTTSFGCWVDSNGVSHSDAGDNCIPACSLSSIGCSGMSGPQCERMHNWYAADADRFGCGTKIKVTNPDNGKSAILIVIDRGPNCSIENNVDFWVLDMSYRASYYLFGGPTSAGEHANVDVVVVDDSEPLGPNSGAAVCVGDGV